MSDWIDIEDVAPPTEKWIDVTRWLGDPEYESMRMIHANIDVLAHCRSVGITHWKTCI